MAEEGEGNVINTRKRKSTEPISVAAAAADKEEHGPPEKIHKANEDQELNHSTEEAVEKQRSISAENSPTNVDSELKIDEEEEALACDDANTNTPVELGTNTLPEPTTQTDVHNDIRGTSNSDMDDNKLKSEVDVLNGKEDSNNVELNQIDVNIDVADKEDLVLELDCVLEDNLIVLDETGTSTFLSNEDQDNLILLDETGTSTFLSDEDPAKSIATISFASKEAFDSYGQEFLAFCHKYAEFNVNQDVDNLSINIIQNCQNVNERYSTQWRTIDEYDSNADLQASNQQKSSKKKQPRAKKELFTLDATPSITTSGSGCQFTSKFATISNEPNEDIGTNSIKKHNLSTCFNCDGPHALRDCPLPRDQQKINRSRNNFQKKFQQTNRYHVDEEQKYSHMRPGTISSSLRAALGLRDNQIPVYVYRMRVFGYPPGWIEEATEHGSSMAVFGIDGKVEDTGKAGSKFNASKMVQYVGFNVKLDKGMRDEYGKNNVPPFSKDHSTDSMLTYIRKIESTLNDNKEVCDMDLDKDEELNHDKDDDDVNEIIEAVNVVEAAPPGCEEESSSNDTKTSLGDLETQKQQLLAELNESSQSQDNSQDTEPIPIESDLSSVQNTTLETKESPSQQEHSTPSNRLKVSEFGTPIIKSASPYSHLPNPENFSVGVSEIINFKNLPNSTGAYEKMTGLITRVRETLKSLQDSTSA